MRIKLLIAVLLLGGTAPLSAQVVEGYAEPGNIVRFNVRGESDGGLRIGTLARLMADSVILKKCFQCSPLRFGRNDIKGLEVYRGSTYGRSLFFGFFGGLLAGAALGAIFGGALTCGGEACGWAMIPVAGGGLLGALAGIVVGLARGREIWDPVTQ